MEIITETRDWTLAAYTLTGNLIVKPIYKGSISFPWGKSLMKLLAELENLKSEAIEEKRRQGRKISPGPQFQLYDLKQEAENLFIELRPTDYFEAIRDNKLGGLYAQRNEKAKMLREEMIEKGKKLFGNPFALFARVLATNSVIETKDDHYFIQLRGPEVMDYPLAFHNVGGHPKESDVNERYEVESWEKVMRTQIMRELGVREEGFKEIKVIGLAHNNYTFKPDLLCECKLNYTTEEICEERGLEDWEQVGKLIIAKEELPEFLKLNQKKGQLYLGRGLSPIEKYLLSSMIKKVGLDPTTSTNFCPVGEAALVLHLYREGIDVSDIYQSK